MIYLKIKKILDVILSIILIVILSPLFLLLILLIKIDSRGPIFFKQERIGKNKSHFVILKFRTMKIGTPKNKPTHLLENPEIWITRIGKFLRKTSLDEIPQIINILRGEMSFIGPRPALWNQFDLIKERDKYNVHKVYPGITGYAQIKGRDTLPISNKAALDGEYVKKISLWLDIKILLKTVKIVFKSDGVLEGGTGTLKKSKRNKPKV